MPFLRPKIDQRTYGDLVRQTAELVSSSEILVEGKLKKWLSPDENEIDLLASDFSQNQLVDYILNQHLKVDRTLYKETVLTQELVDHIVSNSQKLTSPIKVKARPGAAEREVNLKVANFVPEKLVGSILAQDITISVDVKGKTLTQELIEEIFKAYQKTELLTIRVKAKPDSNVREINLITNAVEPEILVGCILAQDVTPINGKTIEQGSRIDVELADQIRRLSENIKQLKIIKVQENSDSEKFEVDLTATDFLSRILVGKILAQDFITVSHETIKQGSIIDTGFAGKIEKTAEKIKQLKSIKVQVKPDPGWALIRIFSRMAALIGDRLNKVPEKNFLAFLDLLGAQLQPPQPAKVPLTFYLAEGSTSEASVPAHTQISAPPDPDNPKEVVFETERELLVTTAQLKAVYVRQPDQDQYGNWTDAAIGKTDKAFPVFEGDKQIDHCLYIACEEIFSLPDLKELILTIEADSQDSVAQLKPLLLQNQEGDNPVSIWRIWNGKDWKPLEAQPEEVPGAADKRLRLKFSKIPPLIESQVNGLSARWLQVSLVTPLSQTLLSPKPAEIRQIEGSIVLNATVMPDVCLFNSTPLDLSKDFYPFGEQPGFNDTFYIASQAAFSRPGNSVTLTITLNQTKQIKDGQIILVWEGWDGNIWRKLPELENQVESFLTSEEVNFSVPEWLKPNDFVNGKTTYWIRVRILSGMYGTPETTNENIIFSGITKVTKDTYLKTKVTADSTNNMINVESEKGFSRGDTVWLCSSNEFPPQKTSQDKVGIVQEVNENKLTLNTGISGANKDSWVFRNPFEVEVESGEGFSSGNTIWFCSQIPSQGSPQENQVAYVQSVSGKLLTLVSPINATKDSWVIRNPYIVIEQKLAVHTPPAVQSLLLKFTATITTSVLCQSYNDFSYVTFMTTTLREAVESAKTDLKLASVAGLAIGDHLTITDADGENPENHQIEKIDTGNNQITVATGVQIPRTSGARVLYPYPFCPFVQTVDQNPTLYLGFSQPDKLEQKGIPAFNNKPVTLYAEVEPPSPDESLPDAINAETVLSEVLSDKTRIRVEDSRGWRAGDRIQIQSVSESDQPPNNQTQNYFIKEISDNQITLTEPCKQQYKSGDRVIHPTSPVRVVWEYSSPTGWRQLSSVQDETQAFFQRGVIQLIGPADLQKRSQFGQDLYWLRVRWTEGNFWVKPRLRRSLLNTTWARQSMTLKQEELGTSNGDRNQVFYTSQTPVLEGQVLEVREDTAPSNETSLVEEVWVQWQEVPDFYQSRATDRHYVLDRQTGKVQFGDGQLGMIPLRDPHNFQDNVPRFPNNIRMTYQIGGGIQGNKAAKTITQLKTTIPYIDGVVNLDAAGGGAEQEDLEHLKERVPKRLRHRDRAVTKQDLEDLAYAASTEVARVQVITPDEVKLIVQANQPNFFDPLESANWLDPHTGDPVPVLNKVRQNPPANVGQVKIIIVPHSPTRQPTPSLALLKHVETYLRDRSVPGVNLIVIGPCWQAVSVTTEIVPRSLEQADAIKQAVLQQIDSFLHPLSGGRGGEGWTFGRHPHQSDLYRLIQSVPGVDHVHTLKVDPFEKGEPLETGYFICSGSHTVTVTFHGGGDKR